MKTFYIAVALDVSGVDDAHEVASYIAGILSSNLQPEDQLKDLTVYEEGSPEADVLRPLAL